MLDVLKCDVWFVFTHFGINISLFFINESYSKKSYYLNKLLGVKSNN